MAQMVKRLTAKNGVKYGIEIAPQYDFEDDGNYFRGFVYTSNINGNDGFKLPLTQCYSRNDKTVYLCVRVDYLEGNTFTYKEWMETEEWRLADEFNGHGEFDIEVLVSNMERIIAKIKELNGKANEEKIDTKPVVEQLKKEIAEAKMVVAMAKGIDFLSTDIKDYEISKVRDAYRNINMYIDRMYDMISKIESGLIEVKELRRSVERLRCNGYVDFENNNYYAETIKKIALR